jgi:hypothetical protein
MNKHFTPGPWKAVKIDPPVGYAEYEIHYGNDGECIAEVVHDKANAQLIAAAPDLLEALEKVQSLPEFENFWSDTKQMIYKAVSKYLKPPTW